jgi:hypothetical protein
MISYQLGDGAAARSYLSRALGTNPHFSLLYAEAAKETLRELEAVR